MGYFKFTQDCQHYESEWEAVVRQITGRPEYKPYQLGKKPPAHHLEAKALYIFTVARRLICSVWRLYCANCCNWNLIFIETSTLLFPMIELIGEARKTPGTQELGAGIRWLQCPKNLPAKKDPIQDKSLVRPLAQYMNGKPAPRVCDLYYLRNYYLHGAKNVTDRSVPIADIVNAELPKAIAQQAEVAMREYWTILKQDDGTHEWVNRLAQADIRPFIIQGSGIFDAGLVDPNIVDYLENPKATVCS